MKKILPILIILTIPWLLYASPETCIILPNDPRTADQIITACAAGTNSVDPVIFDPGDIGTRELITRIANSLISFGSLLAVGAIVWAGIQYTKAYGDDESLKKAKTTGMYALIGLILLLSSFGLVDIFIRFIYQVVGAA